MADKKTILVVISAETHAALKVTAKAHSVSVCAFCDSLLSARVCTSPLPDAREIAAQAAAESALALAQVREMAAKLQTPVKGEVAPTIADVLALLAKVQG